MQSEIIKNNSKYLVLTPNGWSDFAGIRMLLKLLYVLCKLSNGLTFKCSVDHRLKLDNGLFLCVTEITRLQKLATGLNIIYTLIINKKLNVFDLVLVIKDKEYITDGIVSHNCGNLFHKLWTLALDELNSFFTIILPWHLHPLRDQAWRDKQTKDLGSLEKARRLCDCNFSTSGMTLLSGLCLYEHIKLNLLLPIDKLQLGKLWIFLYPQLNKEYIIAADVARGDGSDYSAFHIIDILLNTQAGDYKAFIPTDKYGLVLVKVAKMYNNALIIVLNATIGWAVIQKIAQLKYKNIYYTKRNFKYVDQLLSPVVKRRKMMEDKQRDIPGFTMTTRSRPLIILKFRQLMEDKLFLVKSTRTYNLILVFIWRGGRALAMGGYNDDLVISLAIGLWVRNSTFILLQLIKKINYRKYLFVKLQGNKRLSILNARNVADDPFSSFKINDNLNIDLLLFYGINKKVKNKRG